MASFPGTKRVLSIQSHVVSGYVGNKCAVFSLQVMGFNVDPIMTVQFSNHTGYPTVKGTRMDSAQMGDLCEGLKANGLMKYSHVLTGYIGTAKVLSEVASVIEDMRTTDTQVNYVCDPVLGDEGRLYVSKDCVPVYRDLLLPLATVLTPNHFELELLTGQTLKNKQDVLAACQQLHEVGPETVIVTSTDHGAKDKVVLLGSTSRPQSNGHPQQFSLTIPKLDAYFTGTGDLLASLILAHVHNQPDEIAVALEKAVAGLQAVLIDTAAHAGDAMHRTERSPDSTRRRELRLIQNWKHLIDPVVTISYCAETLTK